MSVFIASFLVGCLATTMVVVFVARGVWRYLKKLVFRTPLYFPHVPVIPESPMPPTEHRQKSSFGKTLIIFVTVTLILIRVVVHYLGYQPGNNVHKQNERRIEPIEQVVDLVQEESPHTQSHDP